MGDTGQLNPRKRRLEDSTAEPFPSTGVFIRRPTQQTRGLVWYTSERGLRRCRWDSAVSDDEIRRMFERDIGFQPDEVTSLAAGYYNRAYTVPWNEDGKTELRVIRVSLPNEPKWKILSERATMEWVDRNTELPVPHVYKTYHDPDRTADRTGAPSCETWDDCEPKMDLAHTSGIVREIAAFLATTFQKQLRGIGNIYSDPSKVPSASIIPAEWDLSSPKNNIVQRMVSANFIPKSLCQLDYPRGPFKSSNEYMRARLAFAEQDLKARLYLAREWMKARADELHDDEVLEAESQEWDNKRYTTEETMRGELGRRRHHTTNSADSDDESDEDTSDSGGFEYDVDEICLLKNALSNMAKLRDLLDVVFPPPHPDDEPEASTIYHPDMHGENIIVNTTHGKLGGVLDWEWVSAVPLWEACVWPKFLRKDDDENSWHNEPDKDYYWTAVLDKDGKVTEKFCESDFALHMRLYRRTRLREVFRETMQALSPEWVKVTTWSEPLILYSNMLTNYDDPKRLREFDYGYDKLAKMRKTAKT